MGLVRRPPSRHPLTLLTPRFRMGSAIRFVPGDDHFRCTWHRIDYPDPGKVDLDQLYDALGVDGDPFCIVMLGWLGDDSLVLVGGDNELLKPQKALTWLRPTDGHPIAGPVLILKQYGSPGDDGDYWGPLTSEQENLVKFVMVHVYGWKEK